MKKSLNYLIGTFIILTFLIFYERHLNQFGRSIMDYQPSMFYELQKDSGHESTLLTHIDSKIEGIDSAIQHIDNRLSGIAKNRNELIETKRLLVKRRSVLVNLKEEIERSQHSDLITIKDSINQILFDADLELRHASADLKDLF
ncbi:MAG: hypothetical protein RJQ09_00870 [Cyclobacteriaceae bacterium]